MSPPNFDDGEGTCSCPSGHTAGLARRHASGEPGCISGPDADIGKTADERFEAAYAPYHAKVVAECFPKPTRDSVDMLVKRMLVNKLVGEAFRAGWEAKR